MDYEKKLSELRTFFLAQNTKPFSFRKQCLSKLSEWIDAYETEILSALKADLGKSEFEGYLTEVAIVKQELRDASKHLYQWMRPRRAAVAVGQIPGSCRVYNEPYGVVLIMSPWNYPFQLTIAPLIGAICAGNCAVVKPSAYSPETSRIVRRLVEDVFDPRHVFVVEGGRKENAELLEQPFDYIFFTGSPSVGRLVMEKASAHLTPVSLELGGKSPVIVDQTADIALTAKRLAWGKCVNAGQTCVAPDYVLVHASKETELVESLISEIRSMYSSAPISNQDWPKIINQKHFDRLVGLLGSGCISFGGQLDAETRRISPTILTDVNWDSPVMQEEIFGPILPILPFSSLDDVIAKINSRPKPLALYLFTENKEIEKRVLGEVSFGGGCVNDTVIHLATSHMPFGGVGESGMGGYHGKYSFQTFSHQKSVLKRWKKPDVSLRYAPFAGKLKLLKKLI